MPYFISPLGVGVASLATFVAFVIYRVYFSPLSTVPGPLITAITPYYQTYLSQSKIRAVAVRRWHEKYGPIVRVSPYEVSIVSQESIHRVYSDPKASKYMPLYQQFTHFGSNNAFTSEERHEHSWRRKGYSSVYSLSHILQTETKNGRTWSVVGDYINFVESQGRAVEIYDTTSLYATDAITAHLFGRNLSTRCLAGSDENRSMVLGHYENTVRSWVHLTTEFPQAMRVLDFFRGLGERKSKWIGGDRVRDWCYRTWKRAGSADDEKAILEDGIVAAKLKMLDWDEPSILSDLMDQILAGMDTTTDNLSCLIYYLSLDNVRARAVQDALHDRLAAILTQDAFDRTPLPHSTLDAIMHEPYLESILDETMRYFPSITLALPRVTHTDCILDGHKIPRETIAAASPYLVHRDEAVFGSAEDGLSVDEFCIERWIMGEDEAQNEKVRARKRRLWQFGSGGRACVGRHQAMLEANLLLAAIYFKYRTVVDDDTNVEKLNPRVNQWDNPKSFADIAPFQGVKGVVRFVPRNL